MKKLFIILAISSVLAACGRSGSGDGTSQNNSYTEDQGAAAHQSEAAQETTINSNGTEKPMNAVSEPTDPGAKLIAKNDCLGCHKEHDKLVGPAYADVAKKYKESDINMLAEHIIKGGAGHWGDVAMTAHPNLSPDSAKLMVKYILTVK
ncbi:hypothetical protein GCM10027037_09310 [Mucilaginibacter koreensis]